VDDGIPAIALCQQTLCLTYTHFVRGSTSPKVLAMVTTRHTTAAELFQLGPDAPYVLIEGELVEVMSPQGRLHGKVLLKLSSMLDTEIVEPGAGELLVGDVGFVLTRNPDTVLAPDLAFVRAERLTDAGDAYLDFAPDLAIAVVSPRNTLAAIARTTELYLLYGSSEVWVVRPRQRDIIVHRAGASTTTVGENEPLTSPLFPGKDIAVSRIFPPHS
jgi:Uma2 family endonuclease